MTGRFEIIEGYSDRPHLGMDQRIYDQPVFAPFD